MSEDLKNLLREKYSIIIMITYQEAKDFAAKNNDKLIVKDFIEHSVYMKHSDGSTFKFTNAFGMIKNEWFFIFTEHHGYHIYGIEDLIIINIILQL